jgi:hypothetical protein
MRDKKEEIRNNSPSLVEVMVSVLYQTRNNDILSSISNSVCWGDCVSCVIGSVKSSVARFHNRPSKYMIWRVKGETNLKKPSASCPANYLQS